MVTFHDVIACLFPEYFTLKMRLWTSIFISNAVKIADRILTDSDSTQRDLKNLYPRRKMNTVTVYPSMDNKYHPVRDSRTLEKVRGHFHLPEEYILYVGTIEPRKNVVSVARAYALLPDVLQKRYKLVISGGLGWFSGSIIEEIRSVRTSGEIIMIGYAPHDMLPALYSMAALFVFPSFYEGFGLPPLEAMACGIPVITSGNSSLAEVVGDAGTIIEPTDIEQISREIGKLLEDEILRRSQIEKGYERAKKFSPEATASRILRVFRELKPDSDKI